MKSLIMIVMLVVAMMLAVIALSTYLMKMQEITVLKINVSVTTDDGSPQVHLNALKRDKMNPMSVPRADLDVFPAVQAYLAVNMGAKGTQWAVSPYDGAGDYELIATFRSEPANDDTIMLLIWVVDDRGRRISDTERIIKRWSEIERD